MLNANKDKWDTGFGVPVARAGFCVAVFFALMLLFNGVAMLESSKQLEFGRERDFWVAVVRPMAQFSRFSGLYRIRSAAAEKLGGWLNGSAQKKKESI